MLIKSAGIDIEKVVKIKKLQPLDLDKLFITDSEIRIKKLILFLEE